MMRVYFGALALSSGWMTMDQLARAVAQQKHEDTDGQPHRLIGSICKENGFLTDEQVEAILETETRRNTFTPSTPMPNAIEVPAAPAYSPR